MSKILVLDIESTDLVADFGTVLCVGWKWLGEKSVQVKAISDFKGWKKDVTCDKALIEFFYPKMVEADIMVTYFGTGFDKKMLQSKLLEHNLEVPPNTPHVDLFFTVKSNMVLSRKRLENVADFLGCPVKKTRLIPKIWKRAQAGYADAIEYVVDHCEKDVLITEYVYYKMRPYARRHPRVGTLAQCRFCGSDSIQRRGKYITTLQAPKQRVQCQDCGGWDQRKLDG